MRAWSVWDGGVADVLWEKGVCPVGGQFYYSMFLSFCEKKAREMFLFFLQKKERSERTPAYRGGSFLLQ